MVGQAFHGEVVSADASTGIAFKLYKAGSTTEYTLLTTEYVDIQDISIIRSVAGTFGIFADTDVAGKRVIKSGGAAASGVDRALGVSHTCPKGVTPVLIAAVGDVVAIIHGFITGA
jgi:hypothetical protein